MSYGRRLGIRLTESDTNLVAQIAARAGRSESDVIRTLIRSVDVDRVSTGIALAPPLPGEAEAAEHTLAVA